VPDDVPTMAQLLHRAGYQTSVIIANPNAGRLSGLQREVDFMREEWRESAATRRTDRWQSSRYLQETFWDWREAYPGEPYWVHFQTMDTHGQFPAGAPFGGLFASAEQARTWLEWREMRERLSWEEMPVDEATFDAVRQALWDETIAHTDYQIGRLVERLKATGEWENTLLIVAADHSIHTPALLSQYWEQSVTLVPWVSRIPLMFIWPERIAGGRWFSAPAVSMVDVLPTVLDLLNLPAPEVMMGQSLAPLLLGEGEVDARPVIMDQFDVDRRTGEFRGVIEVIDGRWGASLGINPRPPRDTVPFLIFDLWNDPDCLHSIHEDRPDLVEKYTAFLEAQFEAHLALSKYFAPAETVELTPEQLETLRALGYIQ
jgi:arylsulfatase A-like enzyme